MKKGVLELSRYWNNKANENIFWGQNKSIYERLNIIVEYSWRSVLNSSRRGFQHY